MRISALVAALAATVAAGSIAAPASAHQLRHSRSFSKMTLSEIERYQERTIRHDHSTIRYWEKNLCTRFVGTPRILSSVRLLTTSAQCETRRRDLHFHRAQLGWETKELAKTRERIAAQRRRAGYVSGSSLRAYAGPCLAAIIDREDPSWDPRRWNTAGSGAYGLPQALPASKMASAGADWATNPYTQIRWMRGYARSSYGSECGALAFWNVHQSY